MSTVLQIDSLAYRSRLLPFSPGCKLAVGLVPLIICLGFSGLWVSLATIAAMGCAAAVCARLTPWRYIRLLLIPAGFLLISTLTIMLCRVDGPARGFVLFRLAGSSYGVSAESLARGGQLALKSLGAVSCMYFVALNTPMTDILHTLRQLRVPVLLVSLMELVYRYIFVILEEAGRMKTAQDSRLGYQSLGAGLRAVGEMAGMLFIRCMARCDRIYVALQSRGYEGELRLLKQTYADSKALWAAGALGCAALTCVGLWERGIL